jgi:hypothetical protein
MLRLVAWGCYSVTPLCAARPAPPWASLAATVKERAAGPAMVSVSSTFLDFDTDEYNLVIFLNTNEYKITKECTLFFVVKGYQP